LPHRGQYSVAVDNDHDQIDTEHGQQRDNHAAMLASQ
jgi:hypothetical protein